MLARSPAVIGEIWGDPRALDFTATRRLAVASERSRRGRPVWCGSAATPISAARGCAGGSRARRRSPTISIRARRGAGVGRRAVPRARHAARPLERSRMKRVLPSGCRTWRSSAGRRSQRLPPDAPVVLTVEGTHGPVIHAVTKAAAERGARAGARLTDARALDPALVAVPADPAGDAALVRAARALGRALVAVGRGGRATGCGSTSAESRICSAARTGWSRDVQRRFAALGLTARVAIAPTAAAAWALARSPSGEGRGER